MTPNESPRSPERAHAQYLASALLFVGATLAACDREDGAPAVPGDDPTVNLGPLGAACSPFEGYEALEDSWCHEYYESTPYTPQQWEQLACPLGLVLDGCSTDPDTGFAGVCRLEVSMDDQWLVVLVYLYGRSEERARSICEDDDEISSGIPGVVHSVTFYPPWE